jgi:glycosyltransferase involved in cell wall biosynthesis
MPAYNEAATIEAVLDDLYPRIDRVIIVDDGSKDATREITDRWAAGKPKATVIHFPQNRGLSAALRAGWEEVRAMLARGDIHDDDVAFSIDADGQHEPAALDGMIEHLVATDSVCVIGKRDMGYHTSYKKFGNSVMTWIGRVSGGHRFEDIESGYRVFRVGPLLEAQEYYQGYKYSETVEVAVLLTRLGYKVDNTYGINIPVARTRTRLYDAAVDAVCMPLAWYRLACWKAAPKAARGWWLLIFPAIVVTAWSVALAMMLTHSFYLGDDSAHSYAHVWYLSEALFTHHEWPWHVAQLENGNAVMFPYGIIPWLPSAILYPLFGDWIVTFSMVAGFVFMLAGVATFRPAMRSPVLLAIFLLNPLLWNGVTQFQLTTAWSFAFFFFAANQFERRHSLRATLLFAVAVACHPMMGLCAIALYGTWEAVRLRTIPVRLLALAGIATALASPFIWLFLSTPALADAGTGRIALSAADNLRRLSVVLLPLALPPLTRHVYRARYWLPAAAAAITLAVLVFVPPSGLWERSQPRFVTYLAQHPVDPSASYRVASKNNHEDGMVQLMKAGATLANEFFTESEHRHTWPNADAYLCFLATKQVDHVIVSGEYPQSLRTNEISMLERLTASGYAAQEFRGTDGTIAYTVRPPASARRTDLGDCHI